MQKSANHRKLCFVCNQPYSQITSLPRFALSLLVAIRRMTANCCLTFIRRSFFPMASQAQINANRRNAEKSTGPKTPQGKPGVYKRKMAKQSQFLRGNTDRQTAMGMDVLRAYPRSMARAASPWPLERAPPAFPSPIPPIGTRFSGFARGSSRPSRTNSTSSSNWRKVSGLGAERRGSMFFRSGATGPSGRMRSDATLAQ